MSGLDKHTSERMRKAYEVEIDDQTKRQHQSAISEALGEYATDTDAANAPSPRSSRWRLKVRALVTAALVVAPVGTAIAAEGTVPGDLLYPVKLITEPVRSIVDSDVVARHRVDELAQLIDRPAQTDRLSDAVSDAQKAVTDLPQDHPLRDQLSLLTDKVTDEPESDSPQDKLLDTDSPTDKAPPDTGPTDTEPTDADPTDTSPPGDDDQDGTTDSSTDTTSDGSGDQATDG